MEQQWDRECEICPWRLGQYINTHWESDRSLSTFVEFIFPFHHIFLAPQLANVWPGLQEFGIDRLQACLVSEFSVIRENYCNIEKTTHSHVLNKWLLVFYFSLKLNSLISLAILNVHESGRKSKLTGLLYEVQKHFIGQWMHMRSYFCQWEIILMLLFFFYSFFALIYSYMFIIQVYKIHPCTEPTFS